MAYRIEEKDGKVTVVLTGDMYVKAVAGLREDLLKLVTAGRTCFVFEVNELRYIDSAGLGLMVTVMKKVAPQGGEVRVRHARGVVKELFEQTRLDRVFIMESD